MDNCEVLIVGGGPAGSTCAWRLAQAGFDVLLVDKKSFPRDKVCAGWVTPAVIASLRLDVEDYRRGRVFQPIQSFKTARLGGAEVETHYDRPVSYGIRRFEFDHYLLTRAERAGVRVRTETLKSLVRTDGGWVMNDTIRAKLVIGAGGHFCPVARMLGASLGQSESVVAAQEVEFEMDERQAHACRVRGDTPELFFCADLKGYAWCFRKGNFLNIGLGREDNHKLSEHVDAFFEWLKRDGRIPADSSSRFKGHAYLLYPRAPRAVHDEGVLLIGDAAGLAYPQSGEGIRPAVESALIAAEVIAATRGHYARARLASYTVRLTARFGERPGAVDPATATGPGPVKQFIAGKLLANRWFSRYVVIDRWFLHTQQSPLLS